MSTTPVATGTVSPSTSGVASASSGTNCDESGNASAGNAIVVGWLNILIDIFILTCFLNSFEVNNLKLIYNLWVILISNISHFIIIRVYLDQCY